MATEVGQTHLIMRIWHGTTTKSSGDDFFRYLMRTGVPWYRSLGGNRDVIVLRKDAKDTCEFLLLSVWDSIADIEKFAGPDIDRAVYNFDRDREYLLELEPEVVHYRILTGLKPAEPDNSP